jgi:hypothetical protein
MQIGISKNISARLSKVSAILGIKQKELIDRAILVYIDNMTKYLELKQEMKAWDMLSDEALRNFEAIEMRKKSKNKTVS